MSTIKVYAIDRVEGLPGLRVAILVGDDGTVREVAAGRFGFEVREGLIVRVPTSGGRLDWSSATPDEAEAGRRRETAAAILRARRAADPGGDVAL